MFSKIKRGVFVEIVALILALTCCFTACTVMPAPSENATTLTLDYNDGGKSRSRRIYVEEGGTAAEPAAPSREGYVFDCWMTAKNGGEKVSFPYTPEKDVTLYANWVAKKCSIKFDYNYNSLSDIVEADYNSEIAAPAEPERNNYKFRYWRTAPDGGYRVSFPYTVKKDATLYAYWIDADVRIFKVEFYNGEKLLQSAEVEDGGEIRETPNVRKSGYTLAGWSLTPDGNVVEIPYKPTSDCKLYAVWKRQNYNISFVYNYKDAPDNGIYRRISVEGGSRIEMPSVSPTRVNYEFAGWYSTAEGGQEIEFPTEAVRSTMFYAHWKHLPVSTTVFDAEFTEFNPLETFPGYSGSAKGKEVVQPDGKDLGATTLYGDGMSGKGNYVAYMYKFGATIRFVINCDSDIGGVTLKARLASESAAGSDLVIAPSGDYGYRFCVNGNDIDYNPINLGNQTNSKFRDYVISTSVSLKKGENVIELITNNSTSMGGVMTASAPLVDCIKFENYGSAKFTWSPVYDNLL